LAIYTNPFSKRDEVRGDEQAGAKSLRATDGVDHGANGSFTVCAGHMDDFGCRGARRCARWAFAAANVAATFVEQAPSVFESQFDPEALETVKPGERLFVIQTNARCHIHRAAAK